MIYKNVLVPFDKSAHAVHALEQALALVSDDPEALVTVLYVTENTENEDVTRTAAARIAGVQAIDASGVRGLEREFREQKAQEIREAVADIVADAPNTIEYKVATGRPHHAILNFSYDHGCDLIVMGCRGLNALQGMMGSVSYAVTRASDAPVFIVK